MANLEFCDKHNMVAYLKKPTGSEGFQEIVDFLNGSHIRFALTKNPTIYVSLIEKFWQTATVRTVDNGEQEITATVDGKEFTITEASVRRHLQLADVEGISALPTTEIFDQLSLMGNMKRGFSGEHTPLFPSMLAIQAEEGEGSRHPSEPQPPPSTAQPIHEEPQTFKVLLLTLSKKDLPEDTVGGVLVQAKSIQCHLVICGMVQEVNINIPSPVVVKDKGKGIMTESKPKQTKTMLQQRQERAGYEAAVRLQ
ncbi:hypothetical protein Tco_0999034 [Tanacetum coccineum]